MEYVIASSPSIDMVQCSYESNYPQRSQSKAYTNVQWHKDHGRQERLLLLQDSEASERPDTEVFAQVCMGVPQRPNPSRASCPPYRWGQDKQSDREPRDTEKECPPLWAYDTRASRTPEGDISGEPREDKRCEAVPRTPGAQTTGCAKGVGDKA